jgi:hypothetical protein
MCARCRHVFIDGTDRGRCVQRSRDGSRTRTTPCAGQGVGRDLVWLENSREAIRWDVRRCYYQDVFTELGVPELVAAFCNTDDYVYDRASKAYDWRRRLTLGRGDDRCDFCFAATNRGSTRAAKNGTGGTP